MKRLLVFDVAGTLVDHGSRAPIVALQKAFKDENLYPSEGLIKLSMGKNKKEHIHDILDELEDYNRWTNRQKSAARIYHSFNEYILSAIKETNEPIEGVVEALQTLKEYGFKLAFTTGYNTKQAELALEKLDQRLGFTVPLTTSDHCPGRPSPHMIYQSMLLTETDDIRHVYKIGDTVSDFGAGINAGITAKDCIVVKTGSEQERCTHDSVAQFVKEILNEI